MATKGKKSDIDKERLRLLYRISSQDKLDTDSQLRKALELTTDFLNLESVMMYPKHVP